MLILLVSFRNLKPTKKQRIVLSSLLKVSPEKIEYHRVTLGEHIAVAKKERPELILLYQKLSPTFAKLDDKFKYAQFGMADENVLMKVEKVASVRRGPWK